MGSSIPPFFEGVPIHNDNFINTFQAATSVSAGQVVTLNSSGQIAPISAANQFPLGVALTSGILGVAIPVALRGVVNVTVSNATNAGDVLVGSTTAGQMSSVGNTTGTGFTIPVVGIRAIALSSGSANSTILALFL